MKRATITLALLSFCLAVPANALWSVSDKGIWPKTWPKELEPLRKQSRTLVGGTLNSRVHEIPFKDKEEFEAAWPHILEIKSQGAPIFLLRSVANQKERFLGGFKAGVVIRQPPKSKNPPPEKPTPGDRNNRQTWIWTTYIELVVDGEVVDLNTIPLPKDTPIIDERFEKKK